MAKSKRVRYVALKPGKELYRKGELFAAISFFKKERSRLIRQLREVQLRADRLKTEELLALVNHQLSLCNEAAGNEKMADKYSTQGIKYYVGPNNLGFAMMIRDDGMRMLGRGKLVEAEQLIDQAMAIVRRLSVNGQNVPSDRLSLEYWVTQSYVGQVLIATGEIRKGVSLLRTADVYLRDGSKRYRELNNLMALIPYVGLVEQRQLALRALVLNEQHVHNKYKRLWLCSVLLGGTPFARIVKPYLR